MIFKNYDDWKDFCYRLNHPAPEIITARQRFFEECDKLIITQTDNGFLVQDDDLDEAEIIACLKDMN